MILARVRPVGELVMKLHSVIARRCGYPESATGKNPHECAHPAVNPCKAHPMFIA